jgi:hypothetical protein
MMISYSKLSLEITTASSFSVDFFMGEDPQDQRTAPRTKTLKMYLSIRISNIYLV